MVILQQGDLSRVPFLQHYRAKCARCGCVFEFNSTETHPGRDRFDNRRYIECPTCHDRFALGYGTVKILED